MRGNSPRRPDRWYRMKIAQIAPLYEAVPPRLYGGTERIVAHLTNALVELGHEVTLFASAEAHTRATLVPVRDQAIRLDPCPLKSDLAAHLSMLHELHLRRHEFDLLHFHVDLIHFPFFEDFAARTVTTLHGRLDLKDLPEVYSRWHDYPLVSISDDQRKPLASANWLATIHHGLAEGVYTFNAAPGDPYLAFLGRISFEKRPDRAISIAKRNRAPRIGRASSREIVSTSPASGHNEGRAHNSYSTEPMRPCNVKLECPYKRLS